MVAWYWHAHGWGPGLWPWITWIARTDLQQPPRRDAMPGSLRLHR
jgi:hypothetical protein